jgi:DNA polymerase I
LINFIVNTSILPEKWFEIDQADFVSLDIETDGLDPFINKIILLQIKFDTETFIFDVRNLHSGVISIVLRYIKDKLILGHNIKLDLKFLKRYFNFEPTNVYDTMITEVLINNGLASQYFSLKELVQKYCNISLDKDIRDNFINNYSVEITQELLNYSALDVEYLSKIKDIQVEKIRDQKQLKVLELESKLIPVIVDMEINGIGLNSEEWINISNKVRLEVERIKLEIKNDIISEISKRAIKNCLEIANLICIPVKSKKLTDQLESSSDLEEIKSWLLENINLNSTKQLPAILREIYKVQILGPKGYYPLPNTNEKVLNKISNEYPIINKILNYREQSKSLSTYGEKFLEHINPITEKIHCEYNQVGAASGRFSSSRPNMQNIKRESAYRSCFIAPEGYKLGTFDYSQQELRIMASVAKEKEMIEAFKRGEDIHQLTADKVNVVRTIAKNINFAMGYGSTEYGLYKNFGIPIKDGEKYIKDWFNAYTKVKDFMNGVGDFVIKNLYSSTLLGRKRFFEDRHLFESYWDEQRWVGSIKREGANHIIQGTAADCTKRALCYIYYRNPFGEKLKILLQVHDEIVVKLSDDIINNAKAFIEDCMKEAEAEFLIDIPAEVKGDIDVVWKK